MNWIHDAASRLRNDDWRHVWSAIGTVRAGEQLEADFARVRREQSRVRLGASGRELDVAQEARAGSAFLRVREVVPASVGGAEMADARGRFLARRLEADQLPGRVGAFQVVRVQLLAHVGQQQDSHRQRAVVPVGPDLGTVAEDPAHQVDEPSINTVTTAPSASPRHNRSRLKQHCPGAGAGGSGRSPSRTDGQAQQVGRVEVLRFAARGRGSRRWRWPARARHFAPLAALAVSRRRRRRSASRRRVFLAHEAVQARQRVRLAVGLHGEVALQHIRARSYSPLSGLPTPSVTTYEAPCMANPGTKTYSHAVKTRA